MRKIGNAAVHALGNVTETNPAIAKESGLFIQIFDKATTKGSENSIQSNQSALVSARSAQGKIDSNLEMIKIALVQDLMGIHTFCTRLTEAGCAADLTKTGKSLSFKIETIYKF